MNLQGTFVIIPETELNEIKLVQREILNLLKNQAGKTEILLKYIPSTDFMKAINIKRSKFFELVRTNKIRVIRKKRKLYVPVTEIDRYFNNSSII